MQSSPFSPETYSSGSPSTPFSTELSEVLCAMLSSDFGPNSPQLPEPTPAQPLNTANINLPSTHEYSITPRTLDNKRPAPEPVVPKAKKSKRKGSCMCKECNKLLRAHATMANLSKAKEQQIGKTKGKDQLLELAKNCEIDCRPYLFKKASTHPHVSIQRLRIGAIDVFIVAPDQADIKVVEAIKASLGEISTAEIQEQRPDNQAIRQTDANNLSSIDTANKLTNNISKENNNNTANSPNALQANTNTKSAVNANISELSERLRESSLNKTNIYNSSDKMIPDINNNNTLLEGKNTRDEQLVLSNDVPDTDQIEMDKWVRRVQIQAAKLTTNQALQQRQARLINIGLQEAVITALCQAEIYNKNSCDSCADVLERIFSKFCKQVRKVQEPHIYEKFNNLAQQIARRFRDISIDSLVQEKLKAAIEIAEHKLSPADFSFVNLGYQLMVHGVNPSSPPRKWHLLEGLPSISTSSFENLAAVSLWCAERGVGLEDALATEIIAHLTEESSEPTQAI